MSLNPKQKIAVACDDHCLVVACPGSGKSKVVVSKVERIVLEQPDSKVVVVTFSKEGANELRDRINVALNEEQRKQVYISTFHSLALAHLKREKISVRIAKSTEEFVVRAVAKTGLEIGIDEAMQLLQKCKTTPGFVPDFTPPSNSTESQARFRASKIYAEYQEICKLNNVVDFYDIMSLSLNKLIDGSMPILNATHMLVDEFQDCDEIQYQYMMAHARSGKVIVTAVGDDDQAIYAFRNSLGYEGMERFEREANAQRVVLDTNYRCRKEILMAAGRMIEYNGSRMDKRLYANRGTGGHIKVDRLPTRAAEAKEVVTNVISNLYGVGEEAFKSERDRYVDPIEGKKWVVLARNNILLEAVDAEFKSYRIPTIKSFKSIWERHPVTLLLDLMKSFDSKDKINVEHLLHWMGIEDEDLVMIGKLLNSDYSKLFDRKYTDNFNTEKLSAIASRKLKSFIKDLNGWAKGNSRSDPERTNSVITSITHWMISACKKKRDKERLHIALSVLLRVHGSMLERVAFVTKKTEVKDGAGVNLMTMHGSKGLEFENVWIIGAETDIIPSSAGVLEKPSFIDEERRLMYVAMTRAKDNLYISSCLDNTASVFLKEAKLS